MKSRDEMKLGARKASELRKDIFNEMLRTRSHKYRLWLMGMEVMAFVATLFGDRGRAEVVVSLYAALHRIDDVADGDVALPKGYSSIVEYVRDKIRFVSSPGVPRDEVEWLLAYAFALAERVGVNLKEETLDILTSLLFDAERRNPANIRMISRAMLNNLFHRLDIRGTIGLCLKLFHETKMSPENLGQLGEASRIYYTLHDVAEDFRAGLCNIPLEDIERFGINSWDSSSRPIQQWCLEEAQRGLKLLAEHREKRGTRPLRLFTKAVLYLFYERPARKYFERTLQDK